ncbi:MAG: sulfatase-like hydrolase/transferase [Candidatus Glassbacteria bacterium]|nr:sulfatase-like hydrolase/transferase [Candidatus Glassbacteria bacterium]
MRNLPLLLALLIVSATGLLAATAERPNIILLTVDSFRPDRLGCYGCARAVTPNIDKLASRGVTFTNAFSTASWTNASLVSLLTGLYPGVHGVQRRGQSVPPGLTTPTEQLREAGWLVPQVNYMFPMPNYLNLGFTPNRRLHLPEFLAEYADTTFLAWYHYHGPHLPYNPPDKWLRTFLPGGVDTSAVTGITSSVVMPFGETEFSAEQIRIINALYDAEVAAQDEELGEVIAVLDSLELFDSSIVVLTADHGEELFDHGWVGHASTSLEGTLFDEVVRIPLIICLPGGGSAGRRYDGLVQTVDLIPTLFACLGLEPAAPVQGKSLLDVLRGADGPVRDHLFFETSTCGYQCPDSVELTWLRGVRTERWKLIQRREPAAEPTYQLYDLRSDPSEQTDVANDRPQELVRLKGLLAADIFANLAALGQVEKQLAQTGAGSRIAPSEAVEVLFPAESDSLAHGDDSGTITVRWSGPPQAAYRIDYEVGSGRYHLTGSFIVEGNSQSYGPFTRMFWRAFPQYNPWRFRVVPVGKPSLASPWRTFAFR